MKLIAQITIYRKVPSRNEIDRWKWKRWHWKIKKEKETWRLLLLSEGRVSKAIGKRKIEITAIRKRRFDPDNNNGSMKMLLDSMVGLGWLKDDGVKWVDLSVTQRNIKKGEAEGVEIGIYDI